MTEAPTKRRGESITDYGLRCVKYGEIAGFEEAAEALELGYDLEEIIKAKNYQLFYDR